MSESEYDRLNRWYVHHIGVSTSDGRSSIAPILSWSRYTVMVRRSTLEDKTQEMEVARSTRTALEAIKSLSPDDMELLKDLCASREDLGVPYAD